MFLRNNKQTRITDMESWEKAFKEVDQAKHWKPGYSAHALAHHFTCPSVDKSDGIENIRKDLERFGYEEVSIQEAKIEHESKLDVFGKGRVHDLSLWGWADKYPLVVCVEAKVNEGFGLTTERVIAERLSATPNSKIKERVRNIASVLEVDYDDLLPLPYQLLSFIAGGFSELQQLKDGVLYLPVYVYKTSIYDSGAGSCVRKEYIKTMEALGFERCDKTGVVMFKFSDINFSVASAFVEIEPSLSMEEKYPTGILNAFLSLDPLNMSPKGIVDKVEEIRKDYYHMILGV